MAIGRPRQSHCKRGHLLEGENLFLVHRPTRIDRRCLKCHQLRNRRYYRRHHVCKKRVNVERMMELANKL